MKRLFNNKFALALLLMGVLGFFAASIGGEYLHNKVHHHHDEESRQQCPVHQLLVQFIILAVSALASIKIAKTFTLPKLYQSVVSKAHFVLPSLRAPPIV